MIELSPSLIAAIRGEGEKSYPDECCGFLLGSERAVKELVPVINAREDGERYHRFRIEPDEFMRTELAARKKKLDIVGFYHSHPDHPAAPSEYDREHALPCYSYIIVAVEKGRACKMTSWLLAESRSEFTEEKIV
ncbi:MAG: M67 family metallopeptidase [Clostridiales bacterium]|jgi:proteasome lid subunit RPN8/RPN11|nr:M67 family metallopeptidase [Clostridiales bacterium]